MSNPSLIIFDCDGTLVDSQHLIVAAMNLAFEEAKLAPPPREEILSIVGLSLPEAIWRLMGGGDEEMVTKIREGYRDAFSVLRQDPAHNEPMYDGALEAVLELASRPGVVLGIATGKSRPGVYRLLERFELADCFKTIQTADTSPSKPHPGMIERAMSEACASAGNTVMIGDTSFDMDMARNAGTTGLGVNWGYHPVEHLHQSGAYAVATDFPHLMRLLDDVQQANVAAE